MHSKTSSQNLL
ncbi:hypothetical protein BpHYR1_010765 [Brachionus plicatilis]|uniref:Uncharacterized protein n=1 Tax=Brachionus plicatilis TaxID=10195 RepID=A0A3M7QM17_BRAPC|nr:hypothetical protein BpHYR1_010765 [Brachionus plicatilis]